MINQVIAIIGASENKGVALAKILAKVKMHLLLVVTNSHELSALANEIKTEHPDTDMEIVSCPVDASWEADIIVLAISYQAENKILSQIKAVSTQKIVITLSNQVNKANGSLSGEAENSSGEELQKILPYSKVIQVFNTALAAGFSQPSGVNQAADVFITGNDKEALQTVSKLIKLAGFNPIIAGDIS